MDTIRPEDPRLTAYALDELEDAAARAAVEALLRRSKEARRAVDEMRALARDLTEELAAEPAPALDEARRAAIRRAVREAPRAARRLRPSTWIPLALAASLLVVGGVWWVRSDTSPAGGPPQLARRSLAMPSAEGLPLEEEPQLASSEAGARASLALPALGKPVQEPGPPPNDLDAVVFAPGVEPSDPTELSSQNALLDGIEALRQAGSSNPPQPSMGNRSIGVGAGNAAPSKRALGSRRGGLRNQVFGPAQPEASPAPARSRPAVMRDSIAAASKALPDAGRDVQPHPWRYTGPSDTVPPAAPDTETYAATHENPFVSPLREPLSTFSIDVDTGAYANLRRFLRDGRLPPPDAVRLEEMINYFSYDYPRPEGEAPFSVTADLAGCPWQPRHALLRVGLQGRAPSGEEPVARNLVFLIDVSGSMRSQDKLPLVRSSMELLLDALAPRDRVAIVTYAGLTGVVLDSTPCTEREAIRLAIRGLDAGGSTNGGAGIQLAYDLAARYFVGGGTNRVILATDGDFNVGITDRKELQRLIEQEARRGVFLTVLGYGTGNLKDATAEMLADRGNGNYAYIDSLDEARKVLVEGIDATLETIAKDVKIQIEFNPARVGAYRLLGYENRALAAEDFNDDTKDAGEIGAGHQVTALYEIIPAGEEGVPGVDPLKYQREAAVHAVDRIESPEIGTVKLRWKAPEEEVSQKIEVAVLTPPGFDEEAGEDGARLRPPRGDFRFAAEVASFGMLLRHSRYAGGATFATVAHGALASRGSDPRGYRAEFVRLVLMAKALAGRR